jgi:hypothetical protein
VFDGKVRSDTISWIIDACNAQGIEDMERLFNNTPDDILEIYRKLRYYKLPLKDDGSFILFPPKSFNLLNLFDGTVGHSFFLPMLANKRSTPFNMETILEQTENLTLFPPEISRGLSEIVQSIHSKSVFVNFLGITLLLESRWMETDLVTISDKFRESWYDIIGDIIFNFHEGTSESYCINCGKEEPDTEISMVSCKMCNTRYVHEDRAYCEQVVSEGTFVIQLLKCL